VSGARVLVPWLAVGTFLCAGLLWLGQQRRLEGDAFGPGSAFDASPRGLSLAWRYLRERRPRVELLTRPLGRDTAEPRGVVLRVRPHQSPFRMPRGSAGAPLLGPLEESWVRGGGRLVLALDGDYGRVPVKRGKSVGAVLKVFPVWPGVRRLDSPSGLVLGDSLLPGAHALFVRGEEPVISAMPLGQGEVLLLACPDVLENAHLGNADHLALLHALAGAGRAVYFDESVHGLRSETGLFDLLTGWGLGPLMVSLSLLAATLFWRGRARLGPPDPEAPEARSEAVDLLDSLAQPYDRTLRRQEAVQLYLESLRKSLALRTGLRGAALASRLERLLGRRVLPRPSGTQDLVPGEFAGALKTLNDGFRRLDDYHAQPR
jgi:hypothetical protein